MLSLFSFFSDFSFSCLDSCSRDEMRSDQREWKQWRAFVYNRWRWVTFLPPEDVRSGFTDSAFSLLDDLDLFPFSFSAESGESAEGLVLFLKESGKRRLQFSAAWYWTGQWPVLIRRQTYWFRFRPFCVWVLGWSRDRWQNGPERKRRRKNQHVRAARVVLKLFHCSSEQSRLIKTNTRWGVKAGKLKH